MTLDGRTLKTPAGNPLTLPKDQMKIALMIAGEWNGQKALLKSHSLPMVQGYERIFIYFGLFLFSKGFKGEKN